MRARYEKGSLMRRLGALTSCVGLLAGIVSVAVTPEVAFAACAFYGQVVVSSTQAGTVNTPALGSGVQGQLQLFIPPSTDCTSGQFSRANTNQLYDPANGLGGFLEAGYLAYGGTFVPFIETTYPGPAAVIQTFNQPCSMVAGNNFTIRIYDTQLSVSPRWWNVQVSCNGSGYFALPCQIGATYCAGSYWKENTNGGRGGGEIEAFGFSSLFDAHRLMQMKYGSWYNWPNQYCTTLSLPYGWQVYRNYGGRTTDFVVTTGGGTC